MIGEGGRHYIGVLLTCGSGCSQYHLWLKDWERSNLEVDTTCAMQQSLEMIPHEEMFQNPTYFLFKFN